MKEISFQELERAGREAAEKARADAWAVGLPYSYARDGKIIRVYPDGRRTEVIRDGSGNTTEINYPGM